MGDEATGRVVPEEEESGVTAIGRLSDFKPLKRLVLPELGALRCSGLIVIVGPNSSGKTQLLRDIQKKISGVPHELVVASEIEVETPDHDLFMKCLKEEGYVRSYLDDNEHEQFVPRTTPVGTGHGTQQIGSDTMQQWQADAHRATNRQQHNQLQGWYSGFLVTELFLENRLTGLSTVNTIDFETAPPANDLHALHLNEDVRAALSEEVKRAFSKDVWSCLAKGTQLCLRIADEGEVPSAEERHSVHEMLGYRTIESEGDGMKSYINTVVAVLLGRRPVSIIDEPELCLHPPQAYSLGQFLGRNATSENTVTLVATHSSQILRGIIQTAESLQIVRLTRRSGAFAARLVESGELGEAMKKPGVRAESVLDGIFAQAVAIIEGDGDRIVYQAAWDSVAERNFDVHFATTGGVGGIADTAQLYRVLGIPVAVIADLDVLTDVPWIERILEALCDDASVVQALVASAREVAEELSAMPPTISEAKAQEILREMASREFDWKKDDDSDLRSELSKLRSSLDGMRQLKSGGIEHLPVGLRETVGTLVRDLAAHGIFLVPVGELEWWLSGCDIAASRNKKWAWANEAAEFIRGNSSRTDDVWGFIGQVGGHLTSQL